MENIKIGHLYDNIHDLINNNDIKNNKNIIIFLENWRCGFGSSLTIYLENVFIIKNINPDIIIIPHFSNNTNEFKYHDVTEINSFFSYLYIFERSSVISH